MTTLVKGFGIAVRQSREAQGWSQERLAEQSDLNRSYVGEIERGIARQDLLDPGFARDLRDWMTRTMQLFADRLLPVDAQSARIWGQLSAQLGHAGADLLIAATALRHDAVVVTRNVSDFLPTGCRVENPFD